MGKQFHSSQIPDDLDRGIKITEGGEPDPEVIDDLGKEPEVITEPLQRKGDDEDDQNPIGCQ